jgi:hypothetical protein
MRASWINFLRNCLGFLFALVLARHDTGRTKAGSRTAATIIQLGRMIKRLLQRSLSLRARCRLAGAPTVLVRFSLPIAIETFLGIETRSYDYGCWSSTWFGSIRQSPVLEGLRDSTVDEYQQLTIAA